MQRTLVLLKPDCVQRRLIGQIITRFENKGLQIIAMKMMWVTPELARKQYAEHLDKPFYPGLEAFITSAPVVAVVVEGPESVRVAREMMGATHGVQAAAGTIRGEFSSSQQKNLVHASDGLAAATREIELYFRPEEICAYDATLRPWLRAVDE
jgi:nucleoside-diphosphate kinase